MKEMIFSEPTAFLLIIGTFLALFVGSFLNVVIHRLPHMMAAKWNEECRLYLGLKITKPKEKLTLWLPFSHCPHCKSFIRPWHNLPLLSYLFLKGKCAYCKGNISLRYPLVEAITAISSLYVLWRFGLTGHSIAALLFTWYCICLTFIDLEHHLLPDQLTLSLVWLGLLFSVGGLFCSPADAIIGAVAGYLIFALTQFLFKILTGKIGMGQGDYKFLAALGAFLGWQMLPFIILLASIIGIFFAGIPMLIKRQFKSIPLPFGPYLALAGWITLLWGKELIQYYFSVI